MGLYGFCFDQRHVDPHPVEGAPGVGVDEVRGGLDLIELPRQCSQLTAFVVQ